MAGERSEYVNLKWETETVFGVENGGHSWLQPIVLADSLDVADLKREVLANAAARTRALHNVPILGKQSGRRVPFKAYATGLGAGHTSSVTDPTPTALDPFFKSIVGTQVLIKGDTVKAAPAPTINSFTLTTGVGSPAGIVIIGVTMPSTGGVAFRPCTITGGAVVSLIDFPAIPVAGAVVYGSVNYQWTDDIATARSFQALVPRDGTRGYKVLGCQGNSMKLSATAGEVWTVEGDFLVTSWVADTTALAQPATTPLPAPWMDAHALICDYADDTIVQAAIQGELSVAIQRNLQPRRDPNAVQAMSMFNTKGDPGISLEAVLAASNDWLTDFEEGYSSTHHYYHGFFSTSRVPGKVFAVYATKMHQLDSPEESDVDGIQATKNSFGVSVGQATTEFVIAQL